MDFVSCISWKRIVYLLITEPCTYLGIYLINTTRSFCVSWTDAHKAQWCGISESIKSIWDKHSQVTKEDDGEGHYERQVALHRFNNQQKAFAKLQIQKALMDIKFAPICDNPMYVIHD